MDIGAIIIMILFGILLVTFVGVVGTIWVQVHKSHKRRDKEERDRLERRLRKNLEHLRMDNALRIVEKQAEQERLMTEGWLNAILEDVEQQHKGGDN